MTTKQDKNQEKKNRAAWAAELKANPLLNEIFVALQASYFNKLVSTQKGDGYENELKEIHESMQNLKRMESYIHKCIASGRAVDMESHKPDVL